MDKQLMDEHQDEHLEGHLDGPDILSQLALIAVVNLMGFFMCATALQIATLRT
jgi:hypothetical protein